MTLSSITPMILTYNEAPNIGRTLDKLSWATEILIVDSFSTDETLSIVRNNPRCRVIQRQFDSFAAQCNFGLQRVRTDWVLSLDADYIVSDQLHKELTGLNSPPEVAGYTARFIYCINGKPLRSSLYPPRTVLYRKALARYKDEGHGHRVQIEGRVQRFTSPIFHDDRKSLERWFSEQVRYADREVEHLLATPAGQLNRADRLRRSIFPAPLLVFFYTLICRRLILDGLQGWAYVFQRTLAELILSLKLLERRLTNSAPYPAGNYEYRPGVPEKGQKTAAFQDLAE